MIADEQSLRWDCPGRLNLQPENANGPAANALQPPGARTPSGGFRAEHAAKYKIKQ
jgi:hypothetical protein